MRRRAPLLINLGAGLPVLADHTHNGCLIHLFPSQRNFDCRLPRRELVQSKQGQHRARPIKGQPAHAQEGASIADRRLPSLSTNCMRQQNRTPALSTMNAYFSMGRKPAIVVACAARRHIPPHPAGHAQASPLGMS